MSRLICTLRNKVSGLKVLRLRLNGARFRPSPRTSGVRECLSGQRILRGKGGPGRERSNGQSLLFEL